MIFSRKFAYSGTGNSTGKETFGQFRRVQSASDYTLSKKAKSTYCRQSNCLPKTSTLNNGDYLLKHFYEIDSIRSIKTDLTNGLITKLDLKGVSVIKNTQTGESPTTLSKTSVTYLDYTIDPSGALFGNTLCGLNNFENYLVYDFINIDTNDNINEENLLNIQTSTEPYSEPYSDPYSYPYSYPYSEPYIEPSVQTFSTEESFQPTAETFTAQTSGEPSIFTRSQQYNDNQTIAQTSGQTNIQRLIQVFGQSNIQRIPQPSSKPIMQRSFQPTNYPSRQPPSKSNIQQNTQDTTSKILLN